MNYLIGYCFIAILIIALVILLGYILGRLVYKEAYFRTTLELNKSKFSESHWAAIQRVIDK